MIITYYILTGVVLMAALDYLVDWMEDSAGMKDIRKDLGLGGRVLGILIWPIGLVIFLTAFINSYFKNNDNE